MIFLGILNKMILRSNTGKSFSKKEAIDLMISLSSTDANSEKKWKGFYNSLSKEKLEVDCNEYWKDWLNQIKSFC